MKWRESEGSSLGYLVQVKPMAGRGLRHPLRADRRDSCRQGGRCAGSSVILPSLLSMCPTNPGRSW